MVFVSVIFSVKYIRDFLAGELDIYHPSGKNMVRTDITQYELVWYEQDWIRNDLIPNWTEKQEVIVRRMLEVLNFSVVFLRRWFPREIK